ncbi:hypothetical protein ACTXT7_011473 [Hymenolepis weldensis]
MLLELFSNIMNLKTVSFLQSFRELLFQQISEFHYLPEADLTFINWFRKYGDVFRNDLALIPDEERSHSFGPSAQKIFPFSAKKKLLMPN